MLRILLPCLALGSVLAAHAVAEASCQGPAEYSLPLHGQADVAPGCVIELAVAADYVQFDPALVVVRTDGAVLEHTLESELAAAVVSAGHTICDVDTCSIEEVNDFSFSIDRHRLIVDGGLPPDASIEVVTGEGSLLAAFTTAIDDAAGSCPVPDPFELTPPDCVETCDVHLECSSGDDVDEGGCTAGGRSAPLSGALLLAVLVSLRRPARRLAGATPRAAA